MNNQIRQNQENASNAELFLGNLLKSERLDSVQTLAGIDLQIAKEKAWRLMGPQKSVKSVVKLLQTNRDVGVQDFVVQNAAQETGGERILGESKPYDIRINGKLIFVGYFSCFEDARIAINKVRNKYNPKKLTRVKLLLDADDFESILFGNNTICTYCGAYFYKMTIDHVIPISSYQTKRRSSRGLRVYSCRLCNCGKLNYRFFYSFLERFEYVTNKQWILSLEFKDLVNKMNIRLRTANKFTQNFFQSFINKYYDTTRE